MRGQGEHAAVAYQGPTICSPMGSPSDDQPHGSETAGWPERLNGQRYGYQAPRIVPAGSPPMVIGSYGSWSTASAGRPRVGESRKSKRRKSACTRRYTAVRWASAVAQSAADHRAPCSIVSRRLRATLSPNAAMCGPTRAARPAWRKTRNARSKGARSSSTVSTWAPWPSRWRTAASQAASTSASTSWLPTRGSQPSRRPRTMTARGSSGGSGREYGSPGSKPAIASKQAAASATLRAMGPM